MKITNFNAMKTTTKFPSSPYGDDKFLFETKLAQNIKEIFDNLCYNFTLNIPLNKSNIIEFRRSDVLKEYFIQKLEYIIIDIDKVKTSSDRELILKWFRESGYEVILGESRSLYNLKGILKILPMSQKQGKSVLKEIQNKIIDLGKIDYSSLNYASYQAPILKNNVLLYQSGNMYPIPDIKIEVPIVVNVPDNIEQLCINTFVTKGFSFDKLTSVGYNCSHPSEIKSKGGFSWNREHPFNMSHWNKDRNITIWDEVVKTEIYKEYQKKLSKQEVKDIMPKHETTCKTRYLDNSSEEVSDFLDNYDILKIQSAMGTGKSVVIEEVIYQSRKRGLRVLFLTNRISLADDIEKKYQGIKHYLGTEIEENNYNFGDDLVVQIDSLHKFSTKYFDVCIMDEAATTMMHLLTIEHHQKTITSKIFSLSKKKLVLADAFLFDDFVEIFQEHGSRVKQINNKYRDNIKLEVYKQKDNFIYDLIEESKIQPITFSSGSTQILKIVKLILDQNNLTSVTISGETTKEERKLIYASMNSDRPKWDVLMYSPSLTVGVSNENLINTHYHFDTGLSMNVLSSIQMTKRSRKVNKIRFFLNERAKYQSTDILKIQSELTDFNSQDEDGDFTGISKAGVNLSKIIKINNILENRHKVSFFELMKYQFKILGNILHNTNQVKPFLNKISKLVNENEKKEQKQIFEMYKTMSPEALSDIEYKLFATSKVEQQIKLFQQHKYDESLNNLTEKELYLLIEAEIDSPGCIEIHKRNVKKPKLIEISLQNNFVLSEKDAAVLKNKGINLKDYGFRKIGIRYVLNKHLKELYINPRTYKI